MQIDRLTARVGRITPTATKGASGPSPAARALRPSEAADASEALAVVATAWGARWAAWLFAGLCVLAHFFGWMDVAGWHPVLRLGAGLLILWACATCLEHAFAALLVGFFARVAGSSHSANWR